MQIQSLKNFYEVATQKSISRVASLSHISQSALSQQLLKLEEELGIPLLERSNRGADLTKEGELILKHVKTIIRAYDRIIEDVSSIKRDKDSFVVSSSSSAINFMILKTMIVLKDKYRNFSFKLNTMSFNDIQLELENNLCDVALTYDRIDEDNVTSFKLESNELVFVSNPQINFDNNISVESILRYPFILLSDGPDIKRLLNLALLPKGLTINDLNIVFTANSIDIAKNAVHESPAISLLPAISVENDITRSLMKQFIIPELNFNYDIYLSYKNDNYKQSKEAYDDFKKESRRLLR